MTNPVLVDLKHPPTTHEFGMVPLTSITNDTYTRIQFNSHSSYQQNSNQHFCIVAWNDILWTLMFSSIYKQNDILDKFHWDSNPQPSNIGDP